MSPPNLSFEEAEYDYTQGLKPEIRSLIRTRTDLKDMTSLKNACLRLDVQGQQKRERLDEAHFAKGSGSGSKYPKPYNGNATCGFCKRIGHKEEDCLTKKRKEGNGPASTSTSSPTPRTTSLARRKNSIRHRRVTAGASKSSNTLFKP